MKNPAKNLVLRQAAQALAYWLREQHMTVHLLRTRLDAGEDVLTEALAAIPSNQADWARNLVAPLVSGLTPDDYGDLLQFLANEPDCRPHAELLYQPQYFWRHFVPAMEKAKSWLSRT